MPPSLAMYRISPTTVTISTRRGRTDGKIVDDDDLDAVQMDDTKAKWERCLDWLEIISTHYNAVWTLRSAFKDNKRRITIRLLATPPVDNKMMCWRKLLTDTRNFPDNTHWDPQSGVKTLTNGDIIKHLDEAAKIFQTPRYSTLLKSHSTPKNHRQLGSHL